MDTEAVADVAEDVIEAVDTAVDETVETVSRAAKAHLNGTTKGQQIAILGVTAAVGAAVGGTVVYFVAKKRFKLKYEEIAKQEIEDAKKFYSRVNKKTEEDEVITPQDILREQMSTEATEALVDYQGGSPEPVKKANLSKKTKPKPVVENIFTETSLWDYEEELAKRAANPDAPYIISEEEFLEAETDYDQTTLTYFEADDVLSDDKDVPVDDIQHTVGEDNMNWFGHGSKDKNVVYIRNDGLELDFEVHRSTGSYAAEVLGFDSDELQHSANRRRGRPRWDDDE